MDAAPPANHQPVKAPPIPRTVTVPVLHSQDGTARHPAEFILYREGAGPYDSTNWNLISDYVDPPTEPNYFRGNFEVEDQLKFDNLLALSDKQCLQEVDNQARHRRAVHRQEHAAYQARKQAEAGPTLW